jgi:hypothetical protein
MTTSANAPAPPAPVTTTADANDLAAHYIEVMDALIDVVQRETELVRAGHLAQATALEQTKSELARLYVTDTMRLRASKDQLARIAPQVVPELVRRHDEFRALLQVNLTVLATAHAVSEGIVRGVNTEIQRRNIPNTYTAAGQRAQPGRANITPLAVSRSL